MSVNNKLSCIYVYYRHVSSAAQQNKNRHRPEWFTFERAFISLLNSIIINKTSVKIDLTIVFDGDEKSLECDFMGKYLFKFCNGNTSIPYQIKYINGGSSLGAFRKTLDYVKNRKKYLNNELIYILENDYIHAPNWIENVANLFEGNIDFDYISLYDHADKYLGRPGFSEKYKNLKSRIFATSSCHWRTAPSSCASFLVHPGIFFSDYFLWQSRLTDRRIYAILKILKGRVLLTPIPGLSTHCMSDYLSPCVDWEGFTKCETLR